MVRANSKDREAAKILFRVDRKKMSITPVRISRYINSWIWTSFVLNLHVNTCPKLSIKTLDKSTEFCAECVRRKEEKH